MAKSPLSNADKLLSIGLYSEGQIISSSAGLLSACVVDSVNETKIVGLVLRDGDIANGTFPVSDSGDFKVGKKIKLCAGYDGEQDTLFEGIVVKHSLDIHEGSPALHINCESKSSTPGVENAEAALFDITATPSLTLTYTQDIYSFSSEIGSLRQSPSALIPDFDTEGLVQYLGCNDVLVGSTIELVGLGKRVSGNALVWFVEHTIDSGEWRTTVKFYKQSANV